MQSDRERRDLASMVAGRALREAYRNGVSAAELVVAIQEAEVAGNPVESAASSAGGSQ